MPIPVCFKASGMQPFLALLSLPGPGLPGVIADEHLQKCEASLTAHVEKGLITRNGD